MPVEDIIDHPKLKNAPSVVYGSVMRILHHYWSCECQALPASSRELESIGRMTEHLWRNHGPMIMEIVAAVLPSLDHYYQVRLTRKTSIKNLSDRASAARRLKAIRKSETEVRARMGVNDFIPVKRNKRVEIAPPLKGSPEIRPNDNRKRRSDVL